MLHNLGTAQVGNALPGGPAGCTENEDPNLLTQLTLHLWILWGCSSSLEHQVDHNTWRQTDKTQGLLSSLM